VVDAIIRGGTVVTDSWSGAADVLIGQGVIRGLVQPGSGRPAGATEIDASGKLVLPGGVDPHCHVGFTSGAYTTRDDYRQATTAAVFGGTTTIVDFAIPRPGQTPAEAVALQRAKAEQGLCDSALHACVTGWDSTVPAQLKELVHDGVVTVKMFTTYRGETMADEDTILRVMTHLRDLGGMVVIHCEANHIVEDVQHRCAGEHRIAAEHHHHTRPELAEDASVAEVLAIAESLRAPVYFVHQSTPSAVDLVVRARARGVQAFTEAVTHHLVLDDRVYAQAGPERFVCCPPLRAEATARELGVRLLAGEVTTVGSDHCCYDTEQKMERRDDVRHMPNGLPGVETRLPVLFSEFVVKRGLSPERFVALTSANPARLNGLYPRKGSLLPGADADIVIWDPRPTGRIDVATLHMATDYTPFQGLAVTGAVSSVLVGGRIVVDQGVLVDGAPHGRHLRANRLDQLWGADARSVVTSG
jgi:dihydropyrimidinase